MKPQELQKRFSFVRTALLIRNSSLELAPGLGLGIACVAGFNMLVLLVFKRSLINVMPYEGIFSIMYFACAFTAAGTFKGMHRGKSGTDWILLPATPLEKYAAGIAVYVIAFPLGLVLSVFGISALFALISRVFYMQAGVMWNPCTMGGLRWYGNGIIGLVGFLAGSAVFRKRAFLKAAIVYIAASLVSALIISLILVLLRSGNKGFSIFSSNGIMHINGNPLNPADSESLLTWFKALGYSYAYGVFPIFALVFGYFRVAEKEARDEVQ